MDVNKKHYIRVNKAEDIQLNKLSIDELNNRYIDSKGKRYATRFNIRTRKIELIHIALGLEEAKNAMQEYKQQLIQRVNEVTFKGEHFSMEDDNQSINNIVNSPNSLGLSHPNIFNYIMNENQWIKEEKIQISFEGIKRVYLLEFIELVNKYKEKIHRFILSMKSLETPSNQHLETLEIAVGYYDHLIQNNYEEAKRYYLEFKKYPKKAENYLSSVPSKIRKVLEVEYEEKQMNFFSIYFVFLHYLDMFKGIINAITTMERGINNLNPDTVNNIQLFEDLQKMASFYKEEFSVVFNQLFFWAKNEGLFFD